MLRAAASTGDTSVVNRPYDFSKTPMEFLSAESKVNSFGSVKLRFISMADWSRV
jgi:hypothetical protein